MKRWVPWKDLVVWRIPWCLVVAQGLMNNFREGRTGVGAILVKVAPRRNNFSYGLGWRRFGLYSQYVGLCSQHARKVSIQEDRGAISSLEGLGSLENSLVSSDSPWSGEQLSLRQCQCSSRLLYEYLSFARQNLSPKRVMKTQINNAIRGFHLYYEVPK